MADVTRALLNTGGPSCVEISMCELQMLCAGTKLVQCSGSERDLGSVAGAPSADALSCRKPGPYASIVILSAQGSVADIRSSLE